MAQQRKNSKLPSVDEEKITDHPAEGGSYTRCPETGDLALVARTDLEEPTENETTEVDSQESQA